MSKDPVVLPPEGDGLRAFRASCVETALKLCTGKILEAYQLLPPTIQNLTEDELYELQKPDFLTEKLRITFWNEYEIALQEGRPMIVDHFLRGVCSKQAFYSRFLTDPNRVAWLFMPPGDYQAAVDALNKLGLRRQFEILSMPFEDAKGRPDARVMEIVHKVAESIDKRVRGQYAEKSEINVNQRSVNVNVNQNTTEVQKILPGGETVAQIQEKLKVLELRKRDLNRSAVRTTGED